MKNNEMVFVYNIYTETVQEIEVLEREETLSQ